MRWHRRYRANTHVTIARERGVPATLVDYAVEARKKADHEEKRGRGDTWDQVWCVFDRDDHPGFEDAITRAEANEINIAVSNPCLELWFVIHFQDQTAFIDGSAAQSLSRELLECNKALDEAAFRALEELYTDARRRAQLLDAKHEGDGSPVRSNPSSQVWRLVDSIKGEG